MQEGDAGKGLLTGPGRLVFFLLKLLDAFVLRYTQHNPHAPISLPASPFPPAVCYALASLIFPVGFEGEPIGGEPFKLPEHSSVGFAYILFIVALLLLLMGKLIAMKVVCFD